MIVFFILLYVALLLWPHSRRFAVCMLPWGLFGTIYSSMNLLSNYMVNAVDSGGVYDLEKSLFGIHAPAADLAAAAAACKGTAEAIWQSGMLIPSEYFAVHHAAVADVLAGICYMCWVPVPVAFAFWLFFKGHAEWASRFSWAFLTVNLVGFVIYYIHPASPPWYVMDHGFQVVIHTPASRAGLARFDEITGLGVFSHMYKENANVFAAMPSLHASYLLVTTVYAAMSRRPWYAVAGFALLCVGIWMTAVYTGHHYVCDVLAGIATGIGGILLFETIRHFLIKKRVARAVRQNE